MVAKNAAMGMKSNIAGFQAFTDSFAIGIHKSAAGIPKGAIHTNIFFIHR
jgi:hypothetical protein